MENPSIGKTHYSCLPGINLTAKQDQDRLRDGLMRIFGNPSRTTYYQKLRDFTSIPFEVKNQIDELFMAINGLTPEQIWKIWKTE